MASRPSSRILDYALAREGCHPDGKRSHKSIVGCEQDVNLRRFGTSQVQGVESSVARSLKVLGSACCLLIYLNGLVCELQKRCVLQPPFKVRIFC
jgi:hypothetical protein